MIAAWMAYWVAVSALLGVATLVADHVRRLARRPRRWAWVLGIGACLVTPFVVNAARRGWSNASIAAPAAAPGTEVAPVKSRAPVEVARAVPARSLAPSPLAAWDMPLLAAWGLTSATIALVLLGAAMRLRRLRSGWRPAVLHGQPVLVSHAMGPAVAGFLRQEVVIPDWVLAAPERQQRLILLHEREHMRGRDPALLLGALVALILMPWNPVLWWLAHRLRLAIELDCDARVLRAMPDLPAYGALLIEVGRRGGARRVVPVAALSDSPTFLEKRISMMTIRPPRSALLSVMAVVGLSAVPAGAATLMPQPAVERPVLSTPWRSRAVGTDSVSMDAIRAMKSSMRNLMVSQEAYFSDNGRYAPDVATLAAAGYKPDAGVTARLSWASANAYVLEVTDASAPGASCMVHVGWIPRSAWPSTALEKETAPSGTIACDGDSQHPHGSWPQLVQQFMAHGLQSLVLPQERARGATGTYPGDAAAISSNRFDPALHFSFLWADTASWAAKAVYDSIPGKSCIVWAGSRPWTGSHRPRQIVQTDGQHRMAARGEVVCDDF